MEAYSKCGRTSYWYRHVGPTCFNGLRGNSEVSAQKAKYTTGICFVGDIVNVLVPL